MAAPITAEALAEEARRLSDRLDNAVAESFAQARNYADAGLHERPFERGWRQRAIARHRELYARAISGPPPTILEMDPEFAAERGAA